MALQLRYFNEFTSRHYQRLIRVEIFERDYTGSSRRIRMGASIHLSNSGDGREEPIKKLTASLRLLSEINFQFEHLFTADDRKYQVRIFRNGTNIFTGFLESDSYSEPYYSWKNYTVNLTARDNLGRLEDIDYLLTNGDRITGLEQASVVLLRVLDYTGYFLNLFDNIGIRSADMIDFNIVLGQTYINNDLFWDFEDNKPKSCLFVLTSIIQGFGAQIRQVNNGWRIVDQAKFYDLTTVQGNSASFPSYLAPVLNFPLITKAFRWINRDAEMTILPAWKSFKIEQSYNIPESIISVMPVEDDEFVFASEILNPDGYNLPSWTEGSPLVLRHFPNQNDFTIRIDRVNYILPGVIPGFVDIFKSFPIDQTTLTVRIDLDILIDSPASGNKNVSIDIINGSSILTTSGWVAYIAQERELTFNIPMNTEKDVFVLANGIPNAGGIIIKLWNADSEAFTQFDNIKVTERSASGIENNIAEINALINSDNNLIEDDFKFEIGQVPVQSNSEIKYLGGLFTSSGDAQVDWKRLGDATPETLLEKVAIGYDLQNRQPARQVNGTVIWDFDVWTNIDDQNKRLMINSVDEWNLNTDVMTAEFVEVFEYVNVIGEFNDDYNDDYNNQDDEDYNTNTIFTLTQKTE